MWISRSVPWLLCGCASSIHESSVGYVMSVKIVSSVFEEVDGMGITANMLISSRIRRLTVAYCRLRTAFSSLLSR